MAPVISWGHSQYWSGSGNQSTVVPVQSGYPLGMLFEEAIGTTANSSNMRAEYEGPHLALGQHRARITELRGEYEPHSGNFTVEVVTDGVSQGVKSVSIGAGVAVYGSGVYGTATYGGTGRRMFHVMQPIAAEGRTVWVKGVYTGMETFRWFTYAPTIVPEVVPRGFSE